MAQSIRSIMTSNPRTIDANESVAYAAKMMQEEDVGLAPIVEGGKLIGMLTDRDIATRVAAEGRDPEQVKVREVASTQLVTIDPQQDLDEALRIMAKHQVRRLPVVEEDGRLVGVVAQADIARQSDDRTTGQLVEEISESGGQMSSFEEGRYQPEGVVGGVQPVEDETLQEQPEEEGVSRVRAASSRGRKRRTTSRSRSTTRRKSSGTRRKSTGGRKKSTGGRKKTTARKSTSRKRSTGGRKKTTARKSTSRKRSTTGRKKTTARKSTSRKRSTGRKKTTARKSTSRKRSTGRKKTTARKSTSRKRSTGTRRKSTARKSTGTRRKSTSRKRSTGGRTTVRSAGRKGGRATARKRSTGTRKTTSRRRTTRRKSSS